MIGPTKKWFGKSSGVVSANNDIIYKLPDGAYEYQDGIALADSNGTNLWRYPLGSHNYLKSNILLTPDGQIIFCGGGLVCLGYDGFLNWRKNIYAEKLVVDDSFFVYGADQTSLFKIDTKGNCNSSPPPLLCLY